MRKVFTVKVHGDCLAQRIIQTVESSSVREIILARLAIAIGIEFEVERLDAKDITKPISKPISIPIAIKCFPRKDPRTHLRLPCNRDL